MMNVPRSQIETSASSLFFSATLTTSMHIKHHFNSVFMLKIALAKIVKCQCSEIGKGAVNEHFPNSASESVDWFHISAV